MRFHRKSSKKRPKSQDEQRDKLMKASLLVNILRLIVDIFHWR